MQDKKSTPLFFELYLALGVFVAFIALAFYVIASKTNNTNDYTEEDVQHLIASYSECKASKMECVVALEKYAKVNNMQNAFRVAIEDIKHNR